MINQNANTAINSHVIETGKTLNQPIDTQAPGSLFLQPPTATSRGIMSVLAAQMIASSL